MNYPLEKDSEHHSELDIAILIVPKPSCYTIHIFWGFLPTGEGKIINIQTKSLYPEAVRAMDDSLTCSLFDMYEEQQFTLPTPTSIHTKNKRSHSSDELHITYNYTLHTLHLF